MRVKYLLFQSFACLCLIGGLTGCSSPNDVDISLLYITDLHGLLLPEDFIDGEPAKSSLANFSTYKNVVSNDDPDRFVLLCGGDVNVDQPSIYYYTNYVRYEDHISARVLNYLNFDAVQMGANDLFCGAHVNQDLLPEQYQMPYLCANAVDDETGECAMTPYAIIERKGVRIAVLGMMDPRIRFGVRDSYYRGMHFRSVTDCVREWVEAIKANENPDLIVGMFHSSLTADVVGNIPGIDVCLFGSDHKILPENETMINGDGRSIPIVEPMHHCREVARVDFHFTKDQDGKWVHDQGKVERVTLSDYEQDQEFCDYFHEPSQQVNAYLSASIGTFEYPIPAADAVFGPSVIVDIVHNMQLWVTKADISLTNMACSLDGIQSGEFTMRDMFKLYRFDNQVLVEEMTGEEVRSFLEHAIDGQYNTMVSANDHLLLFKYDEKGEVIMDQYGPELQTPHYVYSSAAGIRYVVDVTKPNGHKVTILSMSDGSPFDLSKRYRVAMNDYQAVGGGFHTIQGCGWTEQTADDRCVFMGEMDLRMYFVNFLKFAKQQPGCRNDWKVIPTDWWEKGKMRDYALMKNMFEQD